MQSDCKTPDPATQVASRDEPALSKAYRVLNLYGSQSKPFNVQQECQCLLYICPEEVEDENNKLVTPLGLDVPGYQFVCENEEK